MNTFSHFLLRLSTLVWVMLICAPISNAVVKRSLNKIDDSISVTLLYDEDTKLYGVEKDGKIIVPVEFEEIKSEPSGFICRNSKLTPTHRAVRVYQFYDINGTNLTDGWNDIEWISTINEFKGPTKFLSIRVGDKYGALDMQGRCVVAPKWESVINVTGVPYLRVKTDDNKFGMVNGATGEMLIKPVYDEIVLQAHRLVYPYFQTKLNGFEGVIHIKNAQTAEGVRAADLVEIVAPTKFASIMQENYKYYKCYTGDAHHGTCELRTDEGKVVVKGGKYNELYILSNGMIAYKIGLESGILDAKGKQKFHTHYNTLDYNKKDNNYTTYLGNAKGVIALDGTVIEEPQPTQSERLVKGRKMTYTLIHDEKGRYGVADTIGKVLIPPLFDQIFDSDFYFNCYRDGYVSVRDSAGREIIPISAGYHFIVERKDKKHSNYFTTFASGKQGMCAADGSVIVKPEKWYYVSPYEWNEKNEPTVFKIKGKEGCGLIDTKGKILVPPIYSTVIEYSTLPGVYSVKINSHKGIYSKRGGEIIPPKYTHISKLGDNHYQISDGGFRGVYSATGDCLLPADRYTSVRIGTDPNTGQMAIFASNAEEEAQYSMTGKLLSKRETFAKRSEYLKQAGDAFDKESWRKAAALYEKADKISSSFATTYNMGVCYYNDGDYSKALKHFKAAIGKDHSSEQHSTLCDLLTDTEQRIAERNEHRAQLVAGIFSLVVSTGIDIYAMNQAQKQRRQAIANGNYSEVEHSSSGYDYDEDSTDIGPATTSKQAGKCGFCGGKGSIVEYTANFGIKKDFYCDECQKTVTNGHYHRKCTHCNGTGVR